MKKKVLLLMSCFLAFVLVLAACGNGDDDDNVDTDDNGYDIVDENGGDDELDEPDDQPGEDTGLPDGLYVDENGNYRFTDARTISVALWDRGNERIPDFDESHWADWVAEQMLETHNVIIEWEPISRWDEEEVISTLLGAGAAPDVGVTFSNPLVSSFAEMGGIINLYEYLPEYREFLPNLYGHLLDEFVYWDLNPDTGELWTITGREAQHGRVLTFIREDWLNALDLPIPETLEEFEETLIAFRDRADELPGDIGDDVIPYFVSDDVGWDMQAVIESFIPNDVTEREWFVNGFDDRRFFFEDAIRDSARIFNRWYYEDLLWNDFTIAESEIGHDRIRLGHVGAFTQNWDMPYRPADRWTVGDDSMRANIGDDANYIPITPFPNDAGEIVKYMPNSNARFIFFPHTNDEILASFLYLDFMSRASTLEYLQLGVEGVHRETNADGSITILGETDDHEFPDNMVIPSAFNFDITITANGISDVDILQNAYPGISPETILAARELGLSHRYVFRHVTVRGIEAEGGMSEPLRDARDVLLHVVIAGTPPEDFDEVFDAQYEAWLNLGAREIREERDEAWVEAFGDVDSMPE